MCVSIFICAADSSLRDSVPSGLHVLTDTAIMYDKSLSWVYYLDRILSHAMRAAACRKGLILIIQPHLKFITGRP